MISPLLAPLAPKVIALELPVALVPAPATEYCVAPDGDAA